MNYRGRAADGPHRASKQRVTVHQQTWVKVNAQVDAGVAPLIEALSAFSGIRTLESCEGKDDSAWLVFDAGEENWEPLAKFVFETVAPTLAEDFGDRVNLMMTVSSAGLYRAEMTVSKSIIPAVSKTIKHLAVHARAA